MGRNTFGNVVSVGGGVYLAGEKSLACKAFRSAVKNWCRDKPTRKKKTKAAKALSKKRGKFNDYFYRSLAARDKSIAKNIRREKGDIFRRVKKSAQSKRPHGRHMGEAGKAVKGGKRTQAGANYANNSFNKARRGGAGYDGARGGANRAFRSKQPNKKFYMRFQDGTTPDGKNVEIKGPGDSQRKGQYKDGVKASPKKKLIVVSCKACGVPCSSGCP
jgi:hypothetical protein